MANEVEDKCDSDRIAICGIAPENSDKITEDNSDLIETRLLVTGLDNFLTIYHVTFVYDEYITSISDF